MSVIKSENWDGATAPSIPAGWNVGTPTGAVAIVTTTSDAIPISSPNLIVAGVGTSSGFDTITWGTLDGNAGNVQVQGTFQFNSSGGTGNVAASVFARCNSSTANYQSSDFYELCLAGADAAVEINKYLGGTKSTLFSVPTSSLASGIWYQATLQLSGSPTTSIRAIVQRLTDNYYLQSGGTFGLGMSIITGTDSSSPITGQGYAGWAASTGAAQPVYGDDWSLSTFSPPVGSMAPTAAHDTFSGTSSDYYGALVQTESHDAFAASGMAKAGGSMAMTERHDIASIYARVSPFMQVPEHRDTFAGSATAAAATAMTTTETGDTFLGGLERVAYHVYANTGAGDPINYSLAIDTTSGLTYTASPLSYPGTWSFGVRAFYVISGLEEQNLDCCVTIILDANGDDVTNRPPPTTVLRAFPLAGGAIRAEWIYPPTYGPKTPTGFHVYTGVGALSYATPTATVAWGTGIANSFVTNMTGFTDGTTYTVGVRAFNATAEETNTNTVTVTAIATGPAPVDGLVGFATS